MYEVGIDVGKRSSYIVVAKNGTVQQEGYVENSKEEFDKYLSGIDSPRFVIEATYGLDRIAAILESYNGEIRVAHPMKVRMITDAVKKTDKIDAHTLLQIDRMGYLPQSYLGSEEIRTTRNLCRNRNFFVRQRTAVKNRIHDQAYRLAIDFEKFNRKTLDLLSNASLPLKVLVEELGSIQSKIAVLDTEIGQECRNNRNASFIDSIPGIGCYSALGIASEIGDVNRFKFVEDLWSYAGVVPSIHQSGVREWKGHITKGNTFLKFLLVETVQVHIRVCPNSVVTYAYERVKERAGGKKARIAAARHLLRIIYCLLKDQRNYRP